MALYNKSVTTIKKNQKSDKIGFAILSAGLGARIKTYEPRSLIKINGKTLIERQIAAINNNFNDPEIIGVFGPGINKISKAMLGKIRIVENQNYESTNNSESLRLAINNCLTKSVMFFHGDILFTNGIFESLDFSKSFILYEDRGMIDEKEIGVTVIKNNATILSYGLEDKWCQIAFLQKKELKILRSIFSNFSKHDKKMLTFEVINKIIELGGSFQAKKLNRAKIVEIDCIKDIKNENFNF
jgi:choline kinase